MGITALIENLRLHMRFTYFVKMQIKKKYRLGVAVLSKKEKVKMLEGTMNKIFMFYVCIIQHECAKCVSK